MDFKEIWSLIGTVLAMAAFVQGFFPSEYRHAITTWLRARLHLLYPYAYYVIPEFEDGNLNELYVEAKTYLSTLTAVEAQESSISQAKNQKGIIFSLANNQCIVDTFDVGFIVEWKHICRERNQVRYINAGSSDEIRSFKMKFHRSLKDRLISNYFPHVSATSKQIQRENRDLRLYTNSKSSGSWWTKVPFSHPASFDTLALEPELKSSLLADLEEFIHGEDFYRRVGKVWKRGYLLFGPPGTGKSSLIAAIANKLRYDIYDLELTEVGSNADLRKLLLSTTNKSIVVLEDIDCSLDLSGQRKSRKKETPKVDVPAPPAESDSVPDKSDPSRVTLSGLLNFTDGLFSCCGSERIFIFTTNFVKKLDPALLRPGRMDMHIKLSYCCFPAFETLAKNFLQIEDHPLWPAVEKEMDGSFMTPAEVAEILTRHKRSADVASESLLKALRVNKTKPRPPEDDVPDSYLGSEDGDAVIVPLPVESDVWKEKIS